MIHDNDRAAMYHNGENTFILVKIEKILSTKLANSKDAHFIQSSSY